MKFLLASGLFLWSFVIY